MGTILTRETTRLGSLSLTEWSRETAARAVRFMTLLREEATESYARSRQRRALARLDRRMLQDLGLRPDQVHLETRKWFWEL